MFRICPQSLKLSKTALNDVSPGQIVNLVSNDVSRFEIVAISCCFLWSGPLQTVIAAYFLYQEVGISGFAGMLIIGGIAIFQSELFSLGIQFSSAPNFFPEFPLRRQNFRSFKRLLVTFQHTQLD